MLKIKVFPFLASVLIVLFGCCCTAGYSQEDAVVSYVVSPSENIRFYWKNTTGEIIGNHKNLRDYLLENGDVLKFAMNGGMYNKDHSPQGLYIENGEELSVLDTSKNGYGNFYMQPNGVFYLKTDYTPVICTTKDFIYDTTIMYATQSGPMLLVNGSIHARFIQGSTNLHIRNGVGILPNGDLLFAISKERINFYDFAAFFKKNGCENALYLDGFVSRIYLPELNVEQLDGSFGVIIGQTQ